MKYTALSLVLLFLVQGVVVADTIKMASVVSIKDGDTLTVSQNGQKLKIRLACIDSPEMHNKPFGEAAKNQLQALLPIGSLVSLREVNRDRYGRVVAEVYRNQQSVNLAMVKTGQAVIYRRYFGGCKLTQNQFNQAEMKAKVLKLGFWKQPHPVMPWVYRKRLAVNRSKLRPSDNHGID